MLFLRAILDQARSQKNKCNYVFSSMLKFDLKSKWKVSAANGGAEQWSGRWRDAGILLSGHISTLCSCFHSPSENSHHWQESSHENKLIFWLSWCIFWEDKDTSLVSLSLRHKKEIGGCGRATSSPLCSDFCDPTASMGGDKTNLGATLQEKTCKNMWRPFYFEQEMDSLFFFILFFLPQCKPLVFPPLEFNDTSRRNKT